MSALKKGLPFDNYFDKHIFVLKYAGLWIPEEHETETKLGRIRRIVHRFVLISMITLFQPCECIPAYVNPTLERFLRSIRDQVNHIFCFFKMYIFFRNRKVIQSIMHTLLDEKYCYDEFGHFDSRKIIKSYKNEADRWMIFFLSSAHLICFNMLGMVLYNYFFQADKFFEEIDGRVVYAQPLPVTMYTPFVNETRQSFILLFTFEILSLPIYGWMIVGLDCLFTSLMSCVSAHLAILQEAFKTIRIRCITRLNIQLTDQIDDPLELEVELMTEMKKCIRHLNMLLDVSEKMEDIFNFQTCLQVLASLFEMCLCLYFMSTVLIADVGPEVTYLLTTGFELLLYCWFGNSVTEESIAVTDSIYECDWLRCSRSFKSCMLITMTRLRRPIYMTIGKFTPLTFTTFLSIARVAYSFFTVLKSDAFD